VVPPSAFRLGLVNYFKRIFLPAAEAGAGKPHTMSTLMGKPPALLEDSQSLTDLALSLSPGRVHQE